MSEKRATSKDYISQHREIVLISWPGNDKEVGLLKLNCAELQQAYFESRRRFDKQQIRMDVFAEEALSAEEMVQQCYLMLIDPEARNPKYKVFKSADEARNLLDDDMREYFVKAYNDCYIKKVV